MRWAAILAVLCLGAVAPVLAHPVPFSYLDVRVSASAVDATLVIHVFDAAHDLNVAPADRLLEPDAAKSYERALAALVASRLTISLDDSAIADGWTDLEPLLDRQSVRLSLHHATSLPGRVTISGVLFPYDGQHQTFINVQEGEALTQTVIDARRTRYDYFTGARHGVWAAVTTFVAAGVHHIAIGPDHLLFLVGLLLLGGSVTRLAVIVTSFTVAHSITLTIAVLGLLTPPPRLIEPAIALSIIYVGADNLLRQGGRDTRALIAMAFGLIHGFGFANALREMGLPSRALGWSLFSFNAGVEIGQLVIVVIVASVLGAIRAKSPETGRRIATIGSGIVIVLGAFWFVQRLAF